MPKDSKDLKRVISCYLVSSNISHHAIDDGAESNHA